MTPETDRPLRVLFVHPTYPHTFVSVVDELARRPSLRCCVMIEESYQKWVRQSSPATTFFSYKAEDSPSHPTHLTSAYEGGARNGYGVAQAVSRLAHDWPFDAIVGSASNGCTLYLRGVVDSAVVSYCEHPSFFVQYVRPEFPPLFEQHVFDMSYQALILASFCHSELGLVASRHARSLFPPELVPKIRVQSEGFPLPKITREKASLRRKHGLSVETPIIGFYGRSLEAVRGFDLFLEVFKRIHQLRPSVEAVVIGSETTLYGNETVYLGDLSFKQYALQQTGVAEESIVWRDYLPYDDFLEHLCCLDLAILPTLEGASNWSFFDGMACGTPLLTSNCSYIPELIDDGVEGYLRAPHDIEGLVGTAIRLLDDPAERARIGANARRRIARDHTPERAADGYEKIIREAWSLRQDRRGKLSKVS